jgi:two-component system sensor histidine kinase KdpD
MLVHDAHARSDAAVDGARAPAEEAMIRPAAYALATATVAACTGIDWVIRDAVAESDLVMVYLLGVLVVARLLALGPALWAAVSSVAAFDVLFVAPRFTFAVAETRYLITFAVMGATGFVLASTTARLRTEAQRAQDRAQRLELLYELSRDLVAADLDADVSSLATTRLRESLGFEATLLPPDVAPSTDRRVVDFPLEGPSGRLGVLRIVSDDESSPSPAIRETLAVFARQLTLGLERTRSSLARRRAELETEQERMRSSLLSSVSHDLRTPLGSILGAASALLAPSRLAEDDRTALLLSIHEEASRLARLLDNLLQMTRIEGGALRVEKDFEVPEEVIGAVLARFGERIRDREIVVEIDEQPALVPFDALLMELVIANIIDNAIVHCGPDTPIWIRCMRCDDQYRFVIEDAGPGVPESEQATIFEKFRRREQAPRAGAGLGLAICRAIVRAHGGEISAHDRGSESGLRVVVQLPFDEAPPDAEQPG